jgi:hypothetical protein
MRAIEAAERRRERDAIRRRRELERSVKEEAKLSAIERAHLEVEAYKDRLELLSSVQKSQGEVWNWLAVAASLPPPCPRRRCFHELNAKQTVSVWPPERRHESEAAVEQARDRDEQEVQAALKSYTEQKAEWEKLRLLAQRILAGDHKAFTEALVELSPLSEISDLGSQMHFTVESTELLVCEVVVNGIQAIPSEVKSLTSNEKLSVKPMPKSRFHELYQDYICGCVLRIAREVFAILPVESLLVTAFADMPSPIAAGTCEQPVLSVGIPRNFISGLAFENVSPSDVIIKLTHRSNFKATRKSGAFQPVTPLTVAEISHLSSNSDRFCNLLASINMLREELKSKTAALTPDISDFENNIAI